MNKPSTTRFVPQLIIPSGIMELDFYTRGLHAIELRRWNNDDGSIHVAELSIDGALFHFHEERPETGSFSPATHHGVTAIIGLMVDDVDAVMTSALSAGARLVSPAQDYDYGYRQGKIEDPFGHFWLIEKMI